MAAPTSERLFSLELLVDWVRLEAGLPPPPPPPPPPPVVAVEEELEEAEEEEEEEEEEEAARPPPPSRDLRPAVAFRLLDFPTLLVYPPEGPGAPAPEPRPGLVRFGRGKSCLFRLHAATLHRLLLRTPLHTLLLQLPPGRPTPAPQLLGACSISLAAAAHQVLGPAASGCSQGRRGSFPLHDQVGQRVGDIALGYRLTDLGSSLLSHLERPVASTGGGVERTEVASQAPQETQRPKSEPGTRDADRSLASLKIPKAQKELREKAAHRQTNAGNAVSVEHGKTSPVCANSSGVRSVSPPDQEVTELDIETNTFCPPPLYYTHLTQEKMPPVRGTITIKPQINVPEGLNGIFLEENRATAPTDTDCLKHTKSGTRESPPMLINPPHVQDVGASDQTADHAQTEQNRVNTIRQLPLLNALLVELSVLHNQPVASPTQIHPHLAWLYRTEDKRSPEPSTKCTCKSESKDKLSMGGNEKSVNLQYKRNQVENLKKGKYLEKNSDNPPKRVPRGKLLYGLTKTLKLRLKQTNPDMLVVHEKREQYRKMQAQMLGTKLRIPSSKVKALSFAKVHQKLHQLPKDKCLELDASFAENSDTSKQISGVLGDPSTSQETKLKRAAEKTVDCKHRISNGLLKEIASPANSIVLEGLTPASILEGKMDMKVQSPRVFQQVAVVDRIVVDKEIENKQVKTTDILTDNMSENKPSKNSCSESISELKYSDDFTSPCSSEDFSTTEDTSRILQAHDSSPEAENPKYNQCTSKSSETILSIRKNSSEKSSVLSPPFSTGSPVHSYKRSHISKIQDKSLEETSSISTSDLSLLHWTEEKENHIDQNGMHNSKVAKRDQDMSIKPKTRTGGESSEKSQSPRTSQVSSYLPSNLSELELNVLVSSTSDHFEEEDEIASLNISKQCRDICELVINKLPGYTV